MVPILEAASERFRVGDKRGRLEKITV